MKIMKKNRSLSSFIKLPIYSLFFAFIAWSAYWFLGTIYIENKVLENNNLKFLIDFFLIDSSEKLILFVSIGFILAAAVSTFFRTYLVYYSSKTSMNLSSHVSNKILKQVLMQDYEFHVNQNSGELISSIFSKSKSLINNTFTPLINLFTSFFLIIFIFSFLIFVDVRIALFSVFYFTIIYYL